MAATTCQYCGRDCGNAGARTQHEQACDQNPANQGETAPARTTQTGETQVLPQGGGGAGEQVADTLYVLTNFDEMPAEARRETVNRGAGFFGGLLNRWLDHREADQQRQEARARNAELEPVQDLPACDECGFQFGTEDLRGEQVRCPDCNRLYDIGVKDAQTGEVKA